jgi:hypothetical protein
MQQKLGHKKCIQWVVTPRSDEVGYDGEMKMEAARSSKRLVSYHIITQCHRPKELGLNLHRRENLKSRIQNRDWESLPQRRRRWKDNIKTDLTKLHIIMIGFD